LSPEAARKKQHKKGARIQRNVGKGKRRAQIIGAEMATLAVSRELALPQTHQGVGNCRRAGKKPGTGMVSFQLNGKVQKKRGKSPAMMALKTQTVAVGRGFRENRTRGPQKVGLLSGKVKRRQNPKSCI